MIKKFCLLIGTMLVLHSCTIDDDYLDNDIFIRTQGLEQYGCYNTKDNLYVPTLRNDEFIIINNPYDYRKLVQGCNAQIDFNNYDLIIGQFWVESNTEDIRYVYKKNRYNEYTLFVEFLQNRGGRAKFVTYHAIVPKLHPSDRVYVQTSVSLP